MGFFPKFLFKKRISKSIEAVLVYVKLSDNASGTLEEREKCFVLEDEIIEEIERQKTGEYGGHEFGKGYCVIYMYGKYAEQLCNSIVQVLKKVELRPDSCVVKRYGGVGASEERLDFGYGSSENLRG